MKKGLLLLLVFAIGLFVFPSCKKKKGCTDSNSISYDKDAEEDDGSCQYAGTGGNTTIVAKPEHHDSTIFSQPGYPDSAFIKFNTQEFPGYSPSNYDLVIAGEEGEDHVHVMNLKPGKYYIMMTGRDISRIDSPRVIGGIPYILTQGSGEIVVKVPVTE